MQKKFIKTSDEYTANMLRESGLHELAKEGSKWVFINQPDKMTFSIDDMKDVHQTDILYL